jgi:hypothetical protein
MQRIGRLWAYLGRYTPLEDELSRINQVTIQDLHDLLDAFDLMPVTTGRLLPASPAAS